MLLMFPCFLPGHEPQEALFLSIFHSISAFCNAGFSVFSDSFVRYRGNWALNLVVCFLIVSGGLGFLVMSELRRKITFKRRALSRLSLHSKLVLSTTAILIVSGMFLIAIMEWHNTLAPLSLHDRFLSAFFQSVTARTAGFNTMSIGNMPMKPFFSLCYSCSSAPRRVRAGAVSRPRLWRPWSYSGHPVFGGRNGLSCLTEPSPT